MNTSTKLNILFVLVTLVVASSAKPIITTMQHLRSRLTSVQLDHSEVYDLIRLKRFSNPEKVLPMQAITGMELIKSHLRSLDEVGELDPEVVYDMLYISLKIFREAFKHIAIEEKVLEDRVKELDELEALFHPSFHIEVRQIYHDIDFLLNNLRHIMEYFDISVPDFQPNIVLESEVDGKICDQDCKHERNLYIHQQFNYFIDRMEYTIATLNEES